MTWAVTWVNRTYACAVLLDFSGQEGIILDDQPKNAGDRKYLSDDPDYRPFAGNPVYYYLGLSHYGVSP